MVLWKKESNSNSACYVDLTVAGEEISFLAFQTVKLMHKETIKNDDTSTELRMPGNEQFRAKQWSAAIELYNQSLRHASNGSQNISLAYANRSYGFLQMQKYDFCLADIELASKANYPQSLMPKLDERKAMCLNAMSKNPTKSSDDSITSGKSVEITYLFESIADLRELQRFLSSTF